MRGRTIPPAAGAPPPGAGRTVAAAARYPDAPMSEPVFERYKEALKQGHVATFKGRPREALQYYQEAARLASHRALPFVSMGSALLQLGRAQEAINAYDEALQRAPDDRQALSGKAAA